MEKIVATQSSLLEIINELQKEKENIDSYIKELNEELTNVNKAWSGTDAIKYTQKMKDDYNVILSHLNTCLSSYIEYLKAVYPEYEKHDNKYKDINIEV